jgi:integration host factor subunit beta
LTKSELISRLADANPHLTTRDAEIIVDKIFRVIRAALARGDRVELRDFGTFSLRRYNARVCHNPRTGASFNVGERHFPQFRPGKAMRDRLRRSNR